MIFKHGAAMNQIKSKIPFTLVNIQTETDRQRKRDREIDREREMVRHK